MTTYTIDIPDKCPKCKKNITALAPDGGFYAQLIDCSYGAVPTHRAPIVILAGAEVEEITVFNILCLRCNEKLTKRDHRAVEAARRAIEALKEVEDDQ